MKLHGDLDRFILAGNAVFTLLNVATGNRFTYRVRPSDNGEVFFVSVLTGSDNTSDYSYLGIVREGRFLRTAKSRIGAEALSHRAFSWFWNHRASLPEQVELHHEGRCGRCGRPLTVPESIETGLGPTCAGRV